MASLLTMIERMSDYLDRGRPEVKRIVVNCRRATVIRVIPAQWRGGPIMYRGREIVTKDPVPRPQHPEGEGDP